MKKRNLFSAAYLMMGAAVAFTSCSNDTDVINGGNVNGGEPVQTISLAVANAGDNFSGSRANRPLYSSAAMQDINKVKVVIYKVGESNTSDEDAKKALYGEKEIVAVKVFDNWMNGGVSGEYNNTANGHGRQASWSLSGKDLIKTPGKYVAYAVGYNDNEYNGTEWSNFGTVGKEMYTFPVNVEVNEEPKEIFAGMSNVFEVTKNDQVVESETVSSYHFNASITLHRQVAGAIGYFTNIPTNGNIDHAEQTGSKLRLVASAKNTKAVFAAFNSEFKGDPVTDPDQTTKVKYVVNGFTPATADAKFYNTEENNGANDAFTVYEVELSKWFTEGDTNNDGLLNELDTWTNPLDPSNADKVKVKEGSVLNGKFVIPFEMVANAATFQLQMLDSQGEIIRYWNIRLGSNDPQVTGNKKVTLVANNGTATPNGEEENNVNYSVVRNHIYSIGLRNGGDTPTDPEEPGTDPDKPQDLSDQTLIVRVNDNWEAVHEMEVD